jgi:hypothetical protein
MTAMARSSVRTWVVGLAVVLLGVGVAALLVVRRALEADARRTTERLLGCRVVSVEWVSFGVTDRWRIEGCGVKGELVCEPQDPGCYVVEDVVSDGSPARH